MTTSTPPSGWRALLPAAQWLPAYEARWLKSDIVAGVTLAAYAISSDQAIAEFHQGSVHAEPADKVLSAI